jgi:hypothetical protein
MNQQTELRPEVLAFARLMELRLREKDADKGASWKDKTDLSLLVAAIPKFHSLETSIQRGRSHITVHTVDLANYCMMIADVAGALDAAPAKVEALTNSVERY